MNKEQMQHPASQGDQERELVGRLREFFSQFTLAWKLLWDGRVPLATKLVPFLTMGYLFLPVDFVPDVLLGLGQVDDLVVLLVGLRMFISLCPPTVVAEYKRLTGGHTEQESWDPSEVEIIDLEAVAPESSEQSSEPPGV